MFIDNFRAYRVNIVPWNENITGATLRIAGSLNSPLRVVAGPGTGKTFALIRRVTRLLEEGEIPRRILVSTFTRTASDDLSREIANLGAPGASEIIAGTLHAFCFSLLSRAEVFALTGRIPRPLLSYEERFMLEDLSQLGLGGIRVCQRRLEAFNAAWARLQSEEPGWPDDPGDRNFQFPDLVQIELTHYRRLSAPVDFGLRHTLDFF